MATWNNDSYRVVPLHNEPEKPTDKFLVVIQMPLLPVSYTISVQNCETPISRPQPITLHPAIKHPHLRPPGQPPIQHQLPRPIHYPPPDPSHLHLQHISILPVCPHNLNMVHNHPQNGEAHVSPFSPLHHILLIHISLIMAEMLPPSFVSSLSPHLAL